MGSVVVSVYSSKTLDELYRGYQLLQACLALLELPHGN